MLGDRDVRNGEGMAVGKMTNLRFSVGGLLGVAGRLSGTVSPFRQTTSVSQCFLNQGA